MNGSYAYTPDIWPSVFTVVLLITLAAYAWRRRSIPAARPFMAACLFAAAWAAGSVMELAAVDLQTRIFWFKFQGAWQAPAGITITCFVLEYAWPGRWLTRRNLALLYAPALLGLLLILTNDFHHLAWLGFTDEGQVIPLRGPVNWIMFVYVFSLEIANLIVFAWLFIRSPQHRWPVVIMAVGQTVARLLYVMEAVHILQPTPALDMPPVIFFEYSMYAVALFGFHIFDPIPMARQAAVDQMREGMLVLDLHGLVVSLNPAAQAILGQPGRRLLGRTIQDLLPNRTGITEDLQAAAGDGRPVTGRPEAGWTEIGQAENDQAGTGPVEINLGAGPDARSYQLEASALTDWRGLPVGRLLLLHDVTAQKRAQTQLLEQQRALAILHEREQLARELHDSTGQVLGYAGFQLEVVHDRLLDGQAALGEGRAADASRCLDEAGSQLTRLSSIVEEAHADVREYILNLRLAPSGQRPFFATLRHYLDGFTQNYGIQTGLSVAPGVDEGQLDPEAQMQLFRIIQEALSNIRKHAGARSVQVSFENQDHQVRIYIQDDGQGFDPQQSKGDRHYGLRFMRERAEGLGGVLHVESVVGEGTRVVVEIPVNSEQ